MASTPSKFDGQGQVFKAKLIGTDNVAACRGDEMCQKALITLKASVLVAKEHKQKILLRVAKNGVQIIDASNEVVLHDHAVTRISFIARDATDSRAFGYVYTTADDKFLFVGIKTEKPAEQVVLALSELFQELLEMRKKVLEAEVSSCQQAVSSGAASSAPPVPSTTAAAVPAGPAQNTSLVAVESLAGTAGSPQQSAPTPGAGDSRVSALSGLLELQQELPAVTEVGPIAQPVQSAAAVPSLFVPPAYQPVQSVPTLSYGGSQLAPQAAAMPAVPPSVWQAAQQQPPQVAPLASIFMPSFQYGQPLTGQLYAGAAQPFIGQGQPLIGAAPPFAGAGLPYADTAGSFQPVFTSTNVSALAAALPAAGPANPMWQPRQQQSTWPAPEPFTSDPFFTSASPVVSFDTKVAPLQPQQARPPSAAGPQQQNGKGDIFADIDLLGKQGQRATRKEDFFADVKKPPKKTLQEIALGASANNQQPPATSGNANGGDNPIF